MSHRPSRRQWDRHHAALRAAADRRTAVAAAVERAACAPIVDAFNTELGGDRAPRFSPSIRTAIAAGAPVLEFYCPACQVVGELDLRTSGRHPETPIVSLIPKLSCRRCCPNPPFARLLGLRGGSRK